MESRLSKKRNDFSKQIRRQHISAIMAEYRSKLVDSLQQHEELQFLGGILQNQPNRFSKIKIIILGVISYQNALDTQMEVSTDHLGLASLFKDNKDEKLKVQLNALQTIQIDYTVLVALLKTLAKDICTKIQVVNINFQQSLKIHIPQKLIEKITSIERQVSQLLEIAHACNFLLSTLTHSLHNNHDLLKELTSCLIELSCFKPRQYSSTQKHEITKQVNIKMGQLRQLLNSSIAENLYKLVKNTTSKDLNINIVINILYIFGNIFVSLSYNSIAHTQKYKQLHDLCFGLIKKCVLQINPSMQSEQSIPTESIHNQFSQFASVIVWFIRNQVLILEGLYKASRDPNQGSSDQLVNEQWIMLILNILEYYSNYFKRNKKLSHSDSITLCDIASLLKLLKYDFHLQFSSLCDCLKYLQTFLNSQIGSASIGKLKGQIYEIAAQLLDYQPQEIRQAVQINPNYADLYNFVYELALGSLKGENQSLQSLQLCSTILSNFCNFKTIKQQFYQEVCSNFETLVNLMSKKTHNNVSYDQKRQRIIFIYEFLNQIENHQNLVMKNEMLSYNSISAILILCSAIWEDSKNTDRDVICTLNLLKVMADNDEYTNLLKQVVMGQGYRQQLQHLQAEANAQINLLAYELLELLEIQ